ncbi:HAD family hydrolase [Arenimonas fontis]|uniref:HAD family hydrolase n=1 Tax=Arenimonas fontis TaxID=2608255 RepID=A0A5B2Z9U3_9GAMM|nr:HAD family hydrolase [Arenimonas fontis]KAA2283974.1 HAD family hydrolase [Arenimonas fontis]
MPRALSLDLDDTLWPIWPAIERAEQALDAFLRRHCPRTAARFPVAKMRELRARVAAEQPHIAHDFTRQRLVSLEWALCEAGDDVAMARAAFDVFYEARNRVEFYPDALDALERLAARAPVAALTNGNADLARIGIQGHFRAYVSARDTGVAKPEPPIFLAACERLGAAPHEVLHVGDDPHLDVAGARRAGLRTCWINRGNAHWPRELPRPDLEFGTLAGLADWLERHTLSPDQPLSLETR